MTASPTGASATMRTTMPSRQPPANGPPERQPISLELMVAGEPLACDIVSALE